MAPTAESGIWFSTAAAKTNVRQLHCIKKSPQRHTTPIMAQNAPAGKIIHSMINDIN